LNSSGRCNTWLVEGCCFGGVFDGFSGIWLASVAGFGA
jgi:hypothetical protein